MSKKIKIKDVKEFKINRKTWLRGEQGTLLNTSGHSCCLGFYALACGLKPKHIEDAGSPQDLVDGDVSIRWKTFLLNEVDNVDTSTCRALIDVNDNDRIDDKEREKSLKKIFKSNGVKVKFVG